MPKSNGQVSVGKRLEMALDGLKEISQGVGPLAQRALTVLIRIDEVSPKRRPRPIPRS